MNVGEMIEWLKTKDPELNVTIIHAEEGSHSCDPDVYIEEVDFTPEMSEQMHCDLLLGRRDFRK